MVNTMGLGLKEMQATEHGEKGAKKDRIVMTHHMGAWGCQLGARRPFWTVSTAPR